MLLSTPGLVLHTTPYGESSVVAKVFTRQLGVRSYIIKGVRNGRSRVKQNLMQPLCSVDMVVYCNPKNDLNHVRELTPRHPDYESRPVGNALRFFMTEVLYKAIREEEPMPELWDYVEETCQRLTDEREAPTGNLPPVFMLEVARHLGIEPLDNHTEREPLFDLQAGRFAATANETTLPPALSAMLHDYLGSTAPESLSYPLAARRALIDALIAYFQLHLSGFRNFRSHEILHTIMR